LTNADLTGANLTNADLTGANLTNVKGYNKWLQRERDKLRILRGYKNE
jgi:uncharacterized protein YjbI with pentapeptide repeats